MTYYTERNGLAQWWDRDNMRLSLSRWVYHHPEWMQLFADKLKEAGVDIFDMKPEDDNPTYTIIMDALAELTNADIDEITGVDLNGSN